MNLLKITEKDVQIKNYWTGDLLFINSFKHKTYWFYGKERESKLMHLFQNYVLNSNTVIEVRGT